MLAQMFFVADVHAQTVRGQSLSVTPTLFQMSAVPQQSWRSGVKVINNNQNELTVYAQVVNFAPSGETGEGKFLPIFEESTEGTTLAEWITVSGEPVTIKAEQSYTIPFTVEVPENAAPGGHFAAILIGTKPPQTAGAVRVATSQVVTSLFFVRIAGDVTENGVIREFRTQRSFVSTPQADFEVRFENKGNVHLQPQGEILITNMWGKERGVVPINHQTHFGNVLPASIRKFEFSWKGEQSFSDIGRYKAVLTLAYGDENRMFQTSTLYFYVIPVRATIVVLSVLFTLVLLVRWAIGAYVRRMLFLAGIEPAVHRQPYLSKQSALDNTDVRIAKKVSLHTPVAVGILEFKQKFIVAQKVLGKLRMMYDFIRTYKKFFGSLAAFVLLVLLLLWFVVQGIREQRDYEIVITNPDANTTLSSEEIAYTKTAEGTEPTAEDGQEESGEQLFMLTLVNSSDTPGAAAMLQRTLERSGYSIEDLRSDFEKSKDRSVIVYDTKVQDDALKLSRQLGNVLLSANTSTTTSKPEITVYIGNDFKQ